MRQYSNSDAEANIDKVVAAAELSAGIYSRAPEFKTWAANNGYTDVEVFSPDDLQIGICRKDGNIFISCRGTVPTEFGNFLRDIDIRQCDDPRAIPDGKVHHGFCASLDHIADEATKHALYDKIENYLKQHDPEHNAVITLTGHSLGAAMSTEVLRRLQRDGVPSKRIESITFGEPTSENIPSATGTNEFDVTLRLRVVNGNPDSPLNDLVTQVPPTLSHSGSAMHLVGNGKFEVTNNEPRISFLGGLLGRIIPNRSRRADASPRFERDSFEAQAFGLDTRWRDQVAESPMPAPTKDYELILEGLCQKNGSDPADPKLQYMAQLLAETHAATKLDRRRNGDGDQPQFSPMIAGGAAMIVAIATKEALGNHGMSRYLKQLRAIQHKHDPVQPESGIRHSAPQYAPMPESFSGPSSMAYRNAPPDAIKQEFPGLYAAETAMEQKMDQAIEDAWMVDQGYGSPARSPRR